MTNTQSKEESTVPIGGNLKLRIQRMEITNYDNDANGDGEAFAPSDVNMRRFVSVIPVVVDDGSASTTAMRGVNAMWDEANNAVRLFHSAGADGEMAEMTSNNNEGAELLLLCIGV